QDRIAAIPEVTMSVNPTDEHPPVNGDGKRQQAAPTAAVRVLEEAREALRASEEQYRSLADLIPGVVWTARADGGIDYANQFWFDFTGMTLEQTQGSGWAAALHPDDVERVSRVWSKELATCQSV